MTALAFRKVAEGHTGMGFDAIEECLLFSADGLRRYRVQVGIPAGIAPEAGFPVLFMLDGNAVFERLRHSEQQPAGPVLVVGIGYDTEVTFVADGRAFDYTPPIANMADLRDPRVPTRKAGGADAFIRLLSDTIMPAVFKRYHVRQNATALYGHSYGALCVLHTLFTHTELFQHWIAVSPSLWWHDRHIEKETAAYVAQAQHLPASVTLMAGTDEQLRQQPIGVCGITEANRPAGIPTLPWVESLADQLAAVSELDVTFLTLPGADHRGALHMSIFKAMEVVSSRFNAG
ncbi:alpha/beta hydrolase [Saezia sanguinis]|uniref:alpha/beta hydrolase n=1 Tax=Saezia sanguinis TaxID=1965230 RepID=UPI0030DA09D5